ncbi:hypothetical protein FIBSPDRAFT_962674 [Athelia psychrophila]|uniref:Squalene epoxidase domain-containing protein n=1 Tax=Athelia psychrophila TaxID=1759441 RepID=A0A165ZT12_9AGAM|nr:hypothetical protein FIBSPDRAFT_962674 [Fibularhizoctonia sp. CBS 109695]
MHTALPARHVIAPPPVHTTSPTQHGPILMHGSSRHMLSSPNFWHSRSHPIPRNTNTGPSILRQQPAVAPALLSAHTLPQRRGGPQLPPRPVHPGLTRDGEDREGVEMVEATASGLVEVSELLHTWHWKHKPLSSMINTMSVALYDLFGADDNTSRCYGAAASNTLSAAATASRAPSPFSGLAPAPLMRFRQFCAVAAVPALDEYPALLAGSSAAQQARLSGPSTSATDLSILLHGMMFFHATLARFLERLEMEGEGIEEREWIMMGVINLGSVLEYGKASGVIRNAGGFGAREGTNLGSAGVRVVVKRATTIAEDDESRMDVHSLGTGIQASPANSDLDEAAYEYPAAFMLAAKLVFAMLSQVLKRPTRKASPFARSTINPYATILLTFLTTLTKQPATLAAIDKLIPWEELAAFFMTVPSAVTHSQGLASRSKEPERWVMLTTGCAPPLAEDWYLCDMEWSGEEKSKEVEVLSISGEPIARIDDSPSPSVRVAVKELWRRIARD